MTPKSTLVDQLRGATRLAVEATKSVTDIVESMHQTIGAGPNILGRPLERITKALTAPTYSAVRGITGVVGSGLDLALSKLAPMLGQSGGERNALLAALNGVMGDYLVATANPLALDMQLRADGVTLELDAARARVAGQGVVLLIHGSSMNDEQWSRNGHNHGLALAQALGLVPLFLRYNSGLHVSQNGRSLAELLEQLPVKELVIIGHSMGGLVARSALAFGDVSNHAWRKTPTTLVTLGTPHHGSPLERMGNWADVLLTISRYGAPLARLGHLRSAGVTDLRYGNVVDEHWENRDRFAREGDVRTAVPLPKDVTCFAIAGSAAGESDGLVPVDSALGRHDRLALDFADTWVAPNTNHLDLLSSTAVYDKVLELVTARRT